MYSIQNRFPIGAWAAAEKLWGEVSCFDVVSPGIYWVKTIGHGGIVIDPTIVTKDFLSQVAWDKAQRVYLDGSGAEWMKFFCLFEEDCLCHLVIREHPELFPHEEYGGRETIEQFCQLAIETE